MQTSKEMAQILHDTIRYLAVPSIKYVPEIGTIASYDIVAFDYFECRPIEIVWDVTTDRNTALHIVESFNRYQLSPIHLEEALHDMIN